MAKPILHWTNSAFLVILFFSIGLGACSSSLPPTLPVLTATETPETAKFSKHSPEAPNRLNFTGFSYFMSSIVVDVGFSSRKDDSEGDIITGSRIPRGSDRRRVLETNRIDFDNLTNAQIEKISEYRALLESLPNQRSLAQFNRDDQLAYWLNLHNIVLIEQLANQYPFKTTNRLKVQTPGGSVSLFDAKLITVEGVNLSLNDIRVNIVYQYWRSDPVVIYGFFSGDIGGPSIIPRAYSGEFVENYLRRNAAEFINSVRGVDTFYTTLYVSQIYHAHREIFFQDWPNDLLSHLKEFARPPVSELVANAKDVRFAKYETVVASVPSANQLMALGPGAPAALATSREATSAQSFSDAGPMSPADGQSSVGGQSYGSVGPSEFRTAQSDFMGRLQQKKSRSPSQFWPELTPPSSGASIEDVTQID